MIHSIYRAHRSVKHALARLGSTRNGALPTAKFVAQRERDPSTHLALVAGHFSFRDWSATFGDTEAARIATKWLDQAHIPYDVACHPVNGLPGVDFNSVDATRYTILVFVCGPWDDFRRDMLLSRFKHCVKIGINLSVLNPDHHGFDILIPRDLGGLSAPDIVFASPPPTPVPLAGVVLVHPQTEYGGMQRHARVGEVIDRYLSRGRISTLTLDTLHLDNVTSTRNAVQFYRLIERLDAVITTRLHGLVFALRAGTPVVAIDPIAGGGKVTAQAEAVGWPIVLDGDALNADVLDEAVDKCVSGAMGDDIIHSQTIAREQLHNVERTLLESLHDINAQAVAG